MVRPSVDVVRRLLVLAAGLAQPAAALDVRALLGGGLVALAGVTGRELDGLLGGQAGLELAASFELGVQLGSEEEREVGDPEPEQEDDGPGQGAVGLVVAGE